MSPIPASSSANAALRAWKSQAGRRVLCYAQAHLPAEELLAHMQSGSSRGEGWLVLTGSGTALSLPAGSLQLPNAPLEWLRGELEDPAYLRAELFVLPGLFAQLRAAHPVVPHPLQAARCVVGAGSDLAAQAERIADLTFGSSGDLGMSTRAVRRVEVAERVFSAFSVLLLAACEERIKQHAHAPRWDREQWDFLQFARKIGLDEGATLLIDQPTGLLFTEVDPRMRIATGLRPAPLLCLLRVPS